MSCMMSTQRVRVWRVGDHGPIGCGVCTHSVECMGGVLKPHATAWGCASVCPAPKVWCLRARVWVLLLRGGYTRFTSFQIVRGGGGAAPVCLA